MTAQENEPIRRRKLADDVQDRLLELIRGGTVAPGDTLPSERELMQLYGVGRPAIREAMQNMERMGLISIKHGERPRVAEPSLARTVEQMSETMRHLLVHSPADLDHLKEARATFEVQMARIASQKWAGDDLGAIAAIIDRQEAASADSPRFLEFDGAFHHAIASLSGNPIFASLSQALFGWLSQFHVDLVRRPGMEKLTIREHRGILQAIADRDPDAAGKAMADHLYRANTLYHQAHRDSAAASQG